MSLTQLARWSLSILLQLMKGLHLQSVIMERVKTLFTFMCLFMVKQKRNVKYITNKDQDQNTGMLKYSKKIQKNVIDMALVAEYQN